jgi:hypothetical protein
VLHYAEYIARLPNKRRTRWDYLLVTEGGPTHVFVECQNDSEGIAPYAGEDYFAAIMRAYLALGPLRPGSWARPTRSSSTRATWPHSARAGSRSIWRLIVGTCGRMR